MRDNAGYNRLVGTTLFVLKWELKIISLSIFVHNALSLSEVSSIKNCISLSMAASLSFLIYQNMKIFILSREGLPLMHPFDTVINAKSHLDIKMNIILF